MNLKPEEFQSLANRVTDLLTEYLRNLESMPAYPQTSGAETVRVFGQPAPESGMGSEALDALSDVLRLSRPPGPRFF